MQRALLIGAALALSAGLAQAQPAPAPSAAPTAAPAAPAAPAASAAVGAGLKTGMPVKDASGAPVGTISKLGKTADGAAAVMVNVDGKDIGLLASNLTVDPSGAQAVSSVTKAQLTASAATAPPPAPAAPPPG